jgi:hypothetical protein
VHIRQQRLHRCLGDNFNHDIPLPPEGQQCRRALQNTVHPSPHPEKQAPAIAWSSRATKPHAPFLFLLPESTISIKCRSRREKPETSRCVAGPESQTGGHTLRGFRPKEWIVRDGRRNGSRPPVPGTESPNPKAAVPGGRARPARDAAPTNLLGKKRRPGFT